MTEPKDGELRIYYKGDFDLAMEDALIKLLKLFGYRFWASGMRMQAQVRDLAFDKEK